MKSRDFFNDYMQAFLRQNAVVNLISKNDESLLWEKHISDSLSISYFFEKYGMPDTMLDIGTGGGFPSVPVALAYPQIEVTALDSIRKKINAILNIKSELSVNNLNVICDRVENTDKKYDLITSRAVASLDKIITLALPRLKKDGYFVAYKSKKVEEEINTAKPVLDKYNAKIVDLIEYNLPLNENYTRNLVVIKFND